LAGNDVKPEPVRSESARIAGKSAAVMGRM
jgi:hypothetical protein